MFFCCPGGGRKHKTKEDLVDAADGFGAAGAPPTDRIASNRVQDGVSVISSGGNSVDRAQMGRLAERMVATSAPGHAPGHASGRATPPGYSRPTMAGPQTPSPPKRTGRFVSQDRARPIPSEDGVGVELATSTAAPAEAPAPDQVAPLPNSVFTQRKRPKDWLSRDRNLSSFDDGHGDEEVARHRLANLAGPWPVGGIDTIERPGREISEEEPSVKPEWLKENVPGMEKGSSVRPRWIQNSVTDTEIVKRVWIDAPEPAVDVRQPRWPEGNSAETPQSVRPGWIDQSGSGPAPSGRHDWREDDESVIARSVRPGWMGQSGPELSPSVRPDGRDDDQSVIAESVRPGWMGQSVGQSGPEFSPSVRPGERDDDQSMIAESVRPGWMGQSMDQSGPELSPSVRPDVRDDDQSVIAESVRPGWIGHSGPELSPSVRPDGRDEDQSVIAESVRPSWMGQSGPELSPSILPEGRDDDESVIAESVRPGWMDQSGPEVPPSVRPEDRNAGQSIGFGGPQQKPFWQTRAESEEGDSVRPGWMEGAVQTVGGIYRMNDDDDRSVRPGWMGADQDSSVIGDSSVMGGPVLHPPGQFAPSPRPDDENYYPRDHHIDGNDYPSRGVKGAPGGRGAVGGDGRAAPSANLTPSHVKVGPGAQRDLKGQPGEEASSPTSPAETMGGQSSFQDAPRPLSELADPLEGQQQSKRATAAAGKQQQQQQQPDSEVGGLLHLLDSTDKQESERRKLAFRQRYSSLPDPRDKIESHEVLRQQPPQQDSAEGPTKIVTIRRSETMPVPDGSAITLAATSRPRREKRPPMDSTILTHRTSPGLAYGSSSGFKHMSPSTTPGGVAAERGSPATPMTAHNSSSGSYASSPSPRIPLPITNPYGGSSPSPAVVNSSPGFAVQGAPKSARRGAKTELRGKSSPSPAAKVMAPSPGAKGRTPSPGNVVASRGGKMATATARNNPSPVMARGDVHVIHGGAGGKAAQGTPPTVAGRDGGRRGRDGAVVRFTGVGSSSSDESSAVGNKDFNPQDFAGRASDMSPNRVPSSITESVSETPASPPDKARDAGKRRGSNSNGNNNNNANVVSGSGSSKSKNSTGASISSRIFSKEARARMSSGSSSASSGDGRRNSDSTTPRRDRQKAGRGGDGVGAQTSRTKNRDPVVLGKSKVEQATGPPPSGGSLKMWQTKDSTREAGTAAAGEATTMSPPAPVGKGSKGLRSMLSSQSPSPQQGQGRGQGRGAGGRGAGAGQASPKVEVSPLIKTPQWTHRGRHGPRFLGTPGQRVPSRSRVRNPPSDLASVDEEPINASPVKILTEHRRHGGSDGTSTSRDSLDRSDDGDASGFENDFEDAPDLGQRLGGLKHGKEAQHYAPTYRAPQAGVADGQFALNNPSPVANTPGANPAATTARVDRDLSVGSRDAPNSTWSRDTAKDKAGDSSANATANATANANANDDKDDKDQLGVKWLQERRHRPVFLNDYFRRSQRLSRSSSMDDGSGGSFCPRAMFSPDRFNAFAGALSLGGSVDDSLCDGSVRSFMTTGTRNSSSSLVSARGLSDRKLLAPQLSKSEKQTVARLKIKRGDVHFGYLTVRGSDRVYKAELNGEVCAAKVLNILRMSKEAQADVFETFDAELLALSRLNTTNIVKVHGASVSPAEIVVVSEFVEGGVLRHLLDNRAKQKDLNDSMRLVIAMDVAAGMKSLYAHGMQHRKLTSSAILLTGDYRAKIVGVGLSMTTEMIAFFLGQEGEDEQEEERLPWASREVLAGAGFSEKSDVYSFGIILWEMMQKDGSLPYAGLTPSEVVGAKYNGEGPAISPHCAPAIKNLMESCWSNLPADRPSFDKICDILQEISEPNSLDRGTPTSRTAGGVSGTFAGAMSVP